MNKVDMGKFKANVIYLLNEKGISIQDFCEQTKLGKNMIYDLDKHLPNLNNAIKIAELLDVSIDYLIGRTENQDKFKELDISNFYKNIENLIEEKGVSKLKFCKDLKLSTDCFTRWRKGSIPYLSTLIEIENYLNCSIDDLFEN